MAADRDFNLGTLLWFAGVALGCVLKDAIDDWLLEQELSACAAGDGEESFAFWHDTRQ